MNYTLYSVALGTAGNRLEVVRNFPKQLQFKSLLPRVQMEVSELKSSAYLRIRNETRFLCLLQT